MFSRDSQLVAQPGQVRFYNFLQESLSCESIWNPQAARFSRCFLPVLSTTPGIIAICVLFFRVLRPLHRYRPKWTRPFITEYDEHAGLLKPHGQKSARNFLIALFLVSFVGLAFEAFTTFYPVFHVAAVLPTISWAAVTLLIAIDSPLTAPMGVLIILSGLPAIQLTLLLNDRVALNVYDIPRGLATMMSVAAILIILCMPLRRSGLPTDDICAPFEPPTHQLRSPEDRLRPWQFMSVSWMWPLISLGSKRQLEEGDVWSLPFEFQHQGLHYKFRELKGSFVKRLFVANGIDLVITSILAVLESLASFAAPVLLQQLLRSMEDTNGPRLATVVYAAISLLVRLISCQSSVFSLWYCRRCYERSRGEMITMLYEKTLSRKIIGHVIQSADLEHLQKQPASTGKILNLMRADVYEVAQRFWEFQILITKPLGLILSIVLIWKLIGWPCLIGIVTLVLAQIINAFITRILLRWERIRRAATDNKLQKTAQYVEAIRHLRWYGWQDFWEDLILQARHRELKLRVRTGMWNIMISFTNLLASAMFPVVSFYAYTVWAGKPLRIDIAFPALQLFSMLESSLREIPGLITVLLNAKIAVDRIEDFMDEPNKEDSSAQSLPTLGEAHVVLKNASFAWPGCSEIVLDGVSLTFSAGFSMVCGEVGAGKTALLQGMLGELDSRGGQLVKPKTMIAYCAQTPWLQSMNIRENILFCSPYAESRYQEVIEACALRTDLDSFKHGDLSNIGENGIGLSGGQRARVALARAVYSRAQILFLDDPLSALDHQTAEAIVQKCFRGPLMEGRTLVLVTHRTDLCRDYAQQTIVISNGKAHALTHDATFSSDLSRVESSESESSGNLDKDEAQAETDVPDAFIDEEKRVHGGVKLKVYWEYIKAGKLKWWCALICVLVLYRLATVGKTWFLKRWGEAYDRPSIHSLSGSLDDLPSPESNIRPWLIWFALIAAIQAFVYLISQCLMLIIVYAAGRQMFKDIMHRVSHATFRFYDVTPVGRLMNRLTSDIGTIDGNISQQFQGVAYTSIKWATSVVIIASVTPTFLVFSFGLTGAFIFIFLQFLPTSQSLRRLEMVSLSPLMSNFGALLNGLTTVRAFCAQRHFQDRVVEVTDAFQKMDHFYWSLQAWLMYRFDALSACSTFIITLLALYTGVSPGLTAFVLIAASQYVNATHSLCKQYGQLQMDFVSVERVVELLHVEQEPPGTIMPPASWPSYGGDIVFEGVTIRYAPHLDPSLRDLSFRIPGRSTTALLGRTGSGKSTLALSLLATIAPQRGRILIDNIDISEVDTQALRHSVTFLAQDPVLFPGTMRQNLDPLDEHSDYECESVLERVCSRHQWKLDTQIDTGGSNLSQGQRQLAGLARAVLRRSAVIILDEATASIDMETAMTIQQTLREEMRESTVITIAHRLEAVKNADFFIRLDKGRVSEQGRVTAEMIGEETGTSSTPPQT